MADHPDTRPIGSEPHVRSHSRFNGTRNLLAINERTKARTRIGNDPTALGKAELGMFPRDHRPFVLFEKEMAGCRVATDENAVAGEAAFVQEFSAAIFSEDNLHQGVSEARP